MAKTLAPNLMCCVLRDCAIWFSTQEMEPFDVVMIEILVSACILYTHSDVPQTLRDVEGGAHTLLRTSRRGAGENHLCAEKRLLASDSQLNRAADGARAAVKRGAWESQKGGCLCGEGGRGAGAGRNG